MKRKRFDISRFVPPGYAAKRLDVLFAAVVLVYGLVILGFFFANWVRARAQLYQNGVLIPGAMMRGFWQMGGVAALRFCKRFVIVAFALAAGSCYGHYWKGTKTLYLMRRLPDPAEWHRRALAIPLVMALGLIAAEMLLVFLTFLFYLCFTPRQCLPPGQWRQLWSVLGSVFRRV